MKPEINSPRWQHYVLLRQEALKKFWVRHLSERERSVLIVVGRGFDPRMCLGLGLLLDAQGAGCRDVLGIEYREGTASPSLTYRENVDSNWAELQNLLADRGT